MKNIIIIRLSSFIWAMMIAMVLQAQNVISGVIKDTSGNPLTGANIIVKGTFDGGTSNSDGRYELTTFTSFPFTLVCTFIGYNKEELSLNGPSSSADMILIGGILLDDDVIISASRKREKIQEAPASVSVITSRMMEASPNDNPIRNLINLPGVTIQQQSAARFNIHLRGDDGNIFGSASFPMQDYRSLAGPGLGIFDVLNSPISNIDLERIEVIRGPASALYGPGVTAGVIHFITKSAINQPGTTIELLGGELNTFGISVRHATKLSDKFGFKINAVYKRGDEFTLDPADSLDAMQIAKFQTTVSVPAISDDVVDVSLPAREILNATDLDPDGNGNPMQDFWKSALLNATLEFRPQDDFSVILSGGVNSASGVFYNPQGEGLRQEAETWVQGRIQRAGFFGQVFYLNNPGATEGKPGWLYQTGLFNRLATRQIEVQLQYNFETPTFLNAEWTTGFDYRLSKNATGHTLYGREEDDDDFTISGGYLQTKLGLADKFDLVLAARVDRFNFLDETSFTPRAILVWKPNPKHTFRVGFNRASSTPTQDEINLDFPVATIIPGAFDIWLLGNKNKQTFGTDPQVEFNGVIPFPSLPVDTPGLPLAYTQGAASEAAIPTITEEMNADPLLAPLVSLLADYLGNPANFVGGTSGTFAGINLFNGQPLGLFNAPSATLRIENTWEVGYKGLIRDKLDVAIDIYHKEIEGATLFTAISPSYTLLNANEIPTALGNAVGSDIENFLTELLTPLVGGQIPDEATLQAMVAQVAEIVNRAYKEGGDIFLQEITPLIEGAILATTPTEQVPNNGVTHVASGFRTLEPYDYWGVDIGLNYYLTNDLSIFGSYSWISKNLFNPNIVGTEGSEVISLLQAPYNLRLGFKYIPQYGIRANLSFQHDPSYYVFLGQFTGETDEKNLVDAGVGYKFENGLMLDVSAQNLFNNEYRTYPNFPKIGRRVLVKATYTFGSGENVKSSKSPL